MKKFTPPHFALLGLLSLLLLYSCKKEISGLFAGKDELLTKIDWAKAYYTENLEKQNNVALKLMTGKSTSSISKSNKKTPLWEKSNSGINDLYTFVEIPIKYEHKITPTFSISKNPNAKPIANQQIIDASFDRLIIYKDKKGKIDQRIISFIPDEAYLTKHKNNISHNSINKLDDDFVGYLHYKDWNGKVLFVLRIEKGKPVKKYDMLKSITGKISIVNNSKINGDKVMVVDDGGEKCYFMTWAWYQDCFEISPELMYCDEPVIYNIQYIEIPCQPPGGGGGGGDPDPCLNAARFATANCEEEPPAETDPLDSILKDTCLNAAQMSALRTMFSSYLDGQGDNDLKCAQMAVYHKFLGSGKKISVCIDQTIEGNGIYNPESATIFYKYEEGLPVVALFGHEFFHGFQDSFYSGGISQYNTGTRTGFPNLEFEQALFYDIINGSSSAIAMGSSANPLIVSEYQNWISSITSNNTIYPKQFSDFGGQFYYFLNLFYQNSTYANIGAINTNLQPLALLNIFSSSNCK